LQGQLTAGFDTTAALTVDRHTIAAIALSGTALNLLGGLYLAYDLFGGEHGPLRTLTRAVTYGLLFFLGCDRALDRALG
jgi:hypothetical protein